MTRPDGPVPVLLVAISLLLVPERQRIRAPTSSAQRMPSKRGTQRRRAVVVGAAAGAALLLLAPDQWWLGIGGSVAVGAAMARWSSGRSPRRRNADRRMLAVHGDLLASCLEAGMAVAPALRAVGAALDGAGHPGLGDSAADLGENDPLATLEAVAAMLALGADPDTAWQYADLDPDLAPLAAAARRSAAGGTAFADAVREHAAALRADTAAESVRAAGRAGVLMTAPLGLCFLPAFLCVGLAPVVVGLLGRLDIF